MPNHVTTILTIAGPDAAIDACLARHVLPMEHRKGERFALDSVIPMPQSIRDTMRPDPWSVSVPGVPAGFVGDAHVEMRAMAMLQPARQRHSFTNYSWVSADVVTWGQLAAWLDKEHPAAKFWARRALLAAAETEHADWYEWSVENWGTKWDAYKFERRDREPGRAVVKFETAWAVPVPVLRELSKLHPALAFSIESIDEGGPHYAGLFVEGRETFARVDEDDDRFRRVYQREPHGDDEEEAAAEAGT